MLKITITDQSGTTRTLVKPNEQLTIDIELPLSEIITAAWHDKINVKEKKNMADLCQDVAEILKKEFGFRILKEDQFRYDDQGNRVITEGHPSPKKESLSLYYCVRYDMTKSDAFANDNLKLHDIKAVIDSDLIIRITDHPFKESGLADEFQHNRENLNKLAKQEGSEPDFTSIRKKEVEISDKVKIDYAAGLAEIVPAVKEEILRWRKDVASNLKRR